LTLRDRIGDTRGTAADHNNLGLLAQRLGDLDEAQRHFDTALVLNRQGGRDEVAATNLINLAGLASLAGDFSHAEALYQDALATWRAHESWASAAVALHGLGQLELRRGDYPAARTALQEARAVLLLERDDALHAQPLLETALRTQLGAGSVRAAALTRVTLGRAVLARGDTAAARGQLTRAAGELDRGGDPVAAAAALGEWAALEAHAGAPIAA